jgi:uncharacterized iron-regulated protein
LTAIDVPACPGLPEQNREILIPLEKGLLPVSKNCTLTLFSAAIAMLFTRLPMTGGAETEKGRVSLWVDLYQGEPISYGSVLEDLASVQVIYLGESHSIERHHDIQAQILDDLCKSGSPVALAMEQIEAFNQPSLDRYSRGEIDFDELVKAIKWDERWNNYAQYREIVETARRHKTPVLALNARAETIRQVARSGGLDKLDAELRRELPADVELHDPLYEKLLNMQMMVHMSASPEKLRPMLEAQMCRDEMMASVLANYLKSEEGKGRKAVVLCGAGHASYGLGTVARVRRRMPELKDRVVLLTQSGDLQLSQEEKAMAREVDITHEQLREIGRPIADYLQVRSLTESDDAK